MTYSGKGDTLPKTPNEFIHGLERQLFELSFDACWTIIATMVQEIFLHILNCVMNACPQAIKLSIIALHDLCHHFPEWFTYSDVRMSVCGDKALVSWSKYAS